MCVLSWSPAGLHGYSRAKLYLYLQIFPEKDWKKKARNEGEASENKGERERKKCKISDQGMKGERICKHEKEEGKKAVLWG